MIAVRARILKSATLKIFLETLRFGVTCNINCAKGYLSKTCECSRDSLKYLVPGIGIEPVLKFQENIRRLSQEWINEKRGQGGQWPRREPPVAPEPWIPLSSRTEPNSCRVRAPLIDVRFSRRDFQRSAVTVHVSPSLHRGSPPRRTVMPSNDSALTRGAADTLSVSQEYFRRRRVQRLLDGCAHCPATVTLRRFRSHTALAAPCREAADTCTTARGDASARRTRS